MEPPERVRVLEVRYPSVPPGVERMHLEGPAPGQVSDWHGFVLRGWVLLKEDAPARIVLRGLVGGVLETPCDRPRPDLVRGFGVPPARARGFLLYVPTTGLPLAFDLAVSVQVGTHPPAPGAVVSGRRRRVTAASSHGLQPLLLVSDGRSGSSLALKALRAHPQVRAGPSSAAEFRPSLVCLRAAFDAANLTTSAAGMAAPPPESLHDPAMRTWLAGPHLERLSEQGLGALAHALGVPRSEDAAPFAEKYGPHLLLLEELLPATRRLFLVRDPRDQVASLLAYAAKVGGHAFGRDRHPTERAFVEDRCHAYRNLHALWQESNERRLLIRYEDLVQHPRKALRRMFTELDMDASRAVVAQVEEAAFRWDEAAQGHATTPSPEDSIGRWRRDLSPETARLVERLTQPAREEWDYA